MSRIVHLINKAAELTGTDFNFGTFYAKREIRFQPVGTSDSDTDTKNIPVHLAANVFNMNGKRWLDNKKTLNLCKEKINKLCWIKNLSVIENPKWNANQNYSEWLARQNGTSWKKKLCDDIDRIVLMENVRSIDDLVVQLCDCGYFVRQGKYLSVRPANLDKRKPVRTLKPGDGYGLEELK